MFSKFSRQGGNLTELIIIVLIIVVLNWIGYSKFVRLDLTAKKQYTISKSTKDVLKGLDDPVTIEVFMSRDLPPQIITTASEVKNKLDEYVRYGHGKIKLTYTDPGDDEKAKERANSMGVQELQLQVIDKGQMTVKKIFFGLAMNFVDKSEPIPQLGDPSTMEYELTSRLLKFTMPSKPKIAFFKGPLVIGQQGQQNNNTPNYDNLRQVLAGGDGLYDLVNLDPQTDKKLPDDTKAVIIAGAFGLPDTLKYSIDQFLLKGGQVLVMVDPMMETGQQMGGLGQAFPSIPTIEDQLEKYGVTFNKKLVADSACANAAFRAGMFTLQQPYELWPQIGPSGLNSDVGPIAQVGQLVVPWSCPLKAKEGMKGLTLTPLFSSSNNSFLVDSPFDLDPTQDWKFKQSTATEKGPFVLGYMVTGKFSTAFDGSKEGLRVPEAKDDGGAPLFPAAGQLKDGDGKGRLLVVSSAKMVDDDFLGRFQQNALFVANMADMLALGDQLANIRSAPIDVRPLKQLNEAQQAFLKWLNVLGVPVLLCLFGLLLWWLRNQQRKLIQARYSD